MPTKDFENFELRLKTLREESREDFDSAENIFKDKYENHLVEIFPRDVLWAKKDIAGRFIVSHVDTGGVNVSDIFEKAVSHTVQTLPLSTERKTQLKNNIISKKHLSETLQSYFSVQDAISRDPFFALIEDFSIDGDISKEEFLLLQQSYESEGDFLKSLQVLPDNIKKLFHAHIEMTLSQEHSSKRWEFEWEFSVELKALSDKWINIEPVVVFVSKCYYKTPGKYKKYEHPKRRMRRTFKIALLKILRAKLWNIDAQIMLDRFEAGENFEDFFMLLFKLLEVINEDPSGEEIYSILKLDEEIQNDVFTAEENKQKIMAGESLVMKIASLFSKTHTEWEETELDEGLLEKVLDESTDMVWEELYFNRPEDENAWIYAQSDDKLSPSPSLGEESEEDEVDYDSMSPEVAYKMLEHRFHKVEEEKYDDIDIFNSKLVDIESKLQKLCKILGKEI